MATAAKRSASTHRARNGALAHIKDAFVGSFHRFIADDVLTLAAALAFYTMLSFAPLIVLAIWASSATGPGAENALLDQVRSIAGEPARAAAEAVIKSGKLKPEVGSVAGIAGIVVLLVGATTVFAQLQSSLNLMFDVVAEPTSAIWGWLRRRVLSIGVMLAIGFVLIVSLVISALLGWLLPSGGLLIDSANQVASALVFAALFGMLFRYLPDARIGWRAAFFGGGATAVLFALGKWAIGVYVARGDVGGAYGAAGSLVVLLVWVYYSAAIFFYGAELTAAALDAWGTAPKPLSYAKRA